MTWQEASNAPTATISRSMITVKARVTAGRERRASVLSWVESSMLGVCILGTRIRRVASIIAGAVVPYRPGATNNAKSRPGGLAWIGI